MTDQYPSLSEDQVRAAELFERLQSQRDTRLMARSLFWVLITFFILNSSFLLYAAFAMNYAVITKAVSTAFDGLLGGLLYVVTKHLFPARCKDAAGAIREVNPPADS